MTRTRRFLKFQLFLQELIYKLYLNSKNLKTKHVRNSAFVTISILLMALLVAQIISPFKASPVSADANHQNWPTDASFSTATTNSQVDFAAVPNSVKLKSTQSYGNGSDGTLIVNGTIAGSSSINGVQINDVANSMGYGANYNGPFNAAHPLILDLYFVKSNNIYSFTTITLQNGASVTHSYMSSGKGGVEGFELNANSSISINDTSKIDITGKSGLSLGTGTCTSWSASGGSYGSTGGTGGVNYGYGAPAGNTYGSGTDISHMGSRSSSTNCTRNTAGGGRVKLSSPAISVSGSIQANGVGGTLGADGGSAGAGGSGGGVDIYAGTLSVNGYISAAGGGGGGGGVGAGSAGLNGTGGGSASGSTGGPPGVAGNGATPVYNERNGSWSQQNGGNSAGAAPGKSNSNNDQIGGGGGAGRIGVHAGIVNGSSLSSLNGTYANTPGASNKIGPYAYYTYVTPYFTLGSLGSAAADSVGLRVDNGFGSKTKFTSLSPAYNTLAVNEAVKFRLRVVAKDTNGNGPQDELEAAIWYGPGGLVSDTNSWTSNYFGSSNIAGDTNPANNNVADVTPTGRYAELMTRLETSTGLTTPTLNSVTLNWNEAAAPTTLASKRTNDLAISSGFTNETTARLVFNGTPTASGNVTPEVEVIPVSYGGAAPSFLGAATALNVSAPPVTGVISTPLTNLTATVTGLSPGKTYYWKAHFYDSAGVQSPWSSQTGAFTVEQDAPSISAFTITGTNVVGANAKSHEVMLNVTATDNGTVKSSPITADLYMHFSNDGTNWGTANDYTTGSITDNVGNCTGSTKYWDGSTCWVQYQATNYPWNLVKGAKDGGVDGTRMVRAQVIDKANNVSGSWTQSTTAEFATGTRGSDIGAGTNTLNLLKPNGAAATDALECASNTLKNGLCVPYVVIIGSQTWMAYNVDTNPPWYPNGDPANLVQYGGLYDWSTAGSKCPSGFHLPSSAEFTTLANSLGGEAVAGAALRVGGSSGFNAQFAGDLFNTNYIGFGSAAWFQTSTPFDLTRSYYRGIYSPGNDTLGLDFGYKTTSLSVRCLSNGGTFPGNGGPGTAGTYISATRDFGAGIAYTNVSWGATIPPQAGSDAIKIQVGVKDVDSGWTDSDYVGPDGGSGTYYTPSGLQSWLGLNNHRYIRYKVYFYTNDSNYPPIIKSVTISSAAGASIMLDTTAPTVDFSTLISPNGGEKWKGGTSKTITWDTTKITDPNSGSNSGLKTAPITLKYATDGTNYTNTIATGLTNGINSGCTPGSGGGCYTWTVPSSVGDNSNNVKVQLIAEDNVGLTSFDVSNTAFAIDTLAPTAVTDLHANLTGASATKNPVSLSWSASTDSVTNVASYNIYRSTTGGQVGNMISTAGTVTGNTYSDTTPSDTTYYYTVRPVDSSSDGGNEQISGNNQVIVLVDNQTPTITVNGFWDTDGNVISPNGNGNTYTNKNNVRLNASSTENGAAGFVSYELSLNGSTWCNLTSISGSNYISNNSDRVVPINLRDVSCGGVDDSGLKNVYIRITDAANNIGTSGATQIYLDQHNPDAFSITGPTTTWSRTQSSPTFTWNASGDTIGIKEYWLWVDKNSSGVFDESEKEVKTTATLSTTLLGPLSNGNHMWKVVAVDFAGNTTSSTQTDWAYGFDNNKPTAILGGQFGITAIYNNQTVKLEWSNKQSNSNGYTEPTGSRTASYVIQKVKNRFLDSTHTVITDNWGDFSSNASSGYNEFTNIPYAPLNFTDDNTLPESDPHYVQPSERYTYRVRVIDTAGNISDWSSSTNWYKTSSTKDNLPPAYPQSITAVSGNDGFSVNLNIAIPANDLGIGTIGYKIYRTTVEDSMNSNDYALVGYLNTVSAQNINYTDNDAHVLAEVQETVTDPNDGVTQHVIVAKTALDASYRLNDHTTYYYRVLGMDKMGNVFYQDANGNPIYDVISKDRSLLPVVNDNLNRAFVTTKDVTNPCWAHYVSTVLSGCDNEGSLSLSATGLDGINDVNDPKQKVDVSWATASDFNNLTRSPAGNGLGIKSYAVSYAMGDTEGPTGQFQTVEVGNNTNITINRLEPKPNYYWFKVITRDNNNVSLTDETVLKKVATLSNDYPNPPYYVEVQAVRGDPNADGTRVGKDINIVFVGSVIKNTGNFITGYKVYRTSETNSTPALVWQINDLSIPGDTRDPGDVNCPRVTPPIATDKLSGTNYGTRCFTDTIPVGEDARKYTYRIYSEGTNPDLLPVGNLTSQAASGVNSNIQGYGWDTVPDATRPATVMGVRVKDIHPDQNPSTPLITNEYRNIVTWERIATPTRYDVSLGRPVNDFREYRLYRKTAGIGDFYEQVCALGVAASCTIANPNPLRSVNPGLTKAQNQEISLGTNYYIDRLGIGSDANKEYYYKLIAVDDAASDFLFGQGTRDMADDNNIAGEPINAFYNTSVVTGDSVDSLNPTDAWPTILPVTAGGNIKASLTYRGVSSLTIHWNTDQATDSIVEYHVIGSNDAFVAAGDTDFKPDHTATIKGLKPGTEYEYKLYSRNKLGNSATAVDDPLNKYSVLPKAETEKFTITYSSSGSKMSTMSAELHWSTNMPSNTNIVEYSLANDASGNGSKAETNTSIDENNPGQYTCVTGATLEPKLCDHSVTIAPLRTSSNYLIKIKAISLDGYVAYTDNLISLWTSESDTSKFTMSPESSNIADRNITATTAQIVWETAIPTRATIYYGTSAGARDLSVVDNQMTNKHVIQITGLSPGVVYYYVVSAEDINGFKYQSPEYSFKAVLKPKISNMTVKNVTPYSATIAWDTNVETETVINWGTTTAYGEKRGKSGTSKVHELAVDSLLDNQEYHYQILAKDETGNEVADTDKIVRTPLDTEGPKITGVKIDVLPMGESDSTSSVIVSWQTNKPATTLVEYDEGVIGGTYGKSSVEDTTLNNSHTVIIKGLTPASSYHYRLVSADKRTNKTVSQDYTFVTPSKEKSILQLILKSLEETFAWTKNLNQFFGNVGKRLTGK